MVREQHQVVFRDFLGVGKLASSSGDREASAQPEIKSEDHGTHDTSWNRASNMQQLNFHKNVWDVTTVEKCGDSQPLGHAGQYGNPGIEVSSPCFINNNSLLQLSSDFGGPMPRSTISFSSWTSKDQVMPIRARVGPELSEASMINRPVGQFPLPGTSLRGSSTGAVSAQTRNYASELSGKPSTSKLTIFYAGNVNVFDGVSEEKAQAIVNLAASNCSWPSSVLIAPVSQGSPLLAAVTSQSRPGSLHLGNLIKQDVVELNANTGLSVSSNLIAVEQVGNPPPTNDNQELPLPNTPSAASSALPPGQPAVPRALPQARKASLARFLEKRKERVQSKSPYLLKQEQSLLVGEGLSSSNSPMPDDECVSKVSVPYTCGVVDNTGSFDGIPYGAIKS